MDNETVEKYILETQVFKGEIKEAVKNINTNVENMREDHKERSKEVFDEIGKLNDSLHLEREERLKKDNGLHTDIKVMKVKSGFISSGIVGIILLIKGAYDWITK